MIEEPIWRRSSHSGSDGGSDCVELASTLDAVRDSKDPAGATLCTVAVRGFVLATKTGQFDR
jgi:hypothetical protein